MSSVTDLRHAMYDEIYSLAENIRDRLAIYQATNHRSGANFALRRERQCLSLGAIHLMVWGLGHRAVASGGITEQQRRKQFTVGEGWLQGSKDAICSSEGSHQFSDLIERSYALLRRCQRLDASIPNFDGALLSME